MEAIKRTLNLHNLLKKKSFFLFGPRATGKSFLIREQLSSYAHIIDLLNSELYLRLSTRPHELEQMIRADSHQAYVVLDEVQRIPALLNEVHRLIEEKGIKFLLTGSSARKLRRKEVNLLAGRAWEASLFPFTYEELHDFQLDRYLRYGGLPPVYLSEEPEEELHAYVNTYLKEEIQAEALVRKIPAFTRFLRTAAITSGQMLNFSSLSNDVGIPVSTVREYYQILEDTFIGFLVPGWTKTSKRKSISTAKFYLFDLGVKNTLAEIKNIDPRSDLFGLSFEHFIALELRAFLSYQRIHSPLNYWRSTYGHEVDFIIGDSVAIEVKSTNRITDKHLKGLRALQDENIFDKYFMISQDPVKRQVGNSTLMHYTNFLDLLWSGKIIK